MKAIISSTYDDKYIYFLPIVTYCWNKLGVDVICFMPQPKSDEENIKLNLCLESIGWANSKNEIEFFTAPEHKEATYAQCARLYGACLDLPEDEILIIGDVDMAMFKVPPYEGGITIFGSDLVPDGQFPMCYASGTVKEWRKAMALDGKTYQQCLDELLGEIECEHMRGNYWGKDQQTIWENTKDVAIKIPRARPGTQFAANRYDRDDSFLLDRLSPDTIDYHMPRPGYEDGNFNQILNVLKYHYPSDDFGWLINYTEKYRSLL